MSLELSQLDVPVPDGFDYETATASITKRGQIAELSVREGRLVKSGPLDAYPEEVQKAVVEYVSSVLLRVTDGTDLSKGTMNTEDQVIYDQMSASIRRMWPQVKPDAPKYERIALVGGGPSLNETEEELRDLVFEGAIVVTLNGAYGWCISRNIQPRMHVVMDARPSTAKFVTPIIPRCRYFVSSQCHPSVFDSLDSAADRYIFHAVTNENKHAELLDEYYGKGRWCSVLGGTTVASRALYLLSALGGFKRFDLFGVDSCWLDNQHHAFSQVENEKDKRIRTFAGPTGHPELKKEFQCAPWHLKQVEDFLQVIRFHGDTFQLAVHGRGMLAHALASLAQAGEVDIQKENN